MASSHGTLPSFVAQMWPDLSADQVSWFSARRNCPNRTVADCLLRVRRVQSCISALAPWSPIRQPTARPAVEAASWLRVRSQPTCTSSTNSLAEQTDPQSKTWQGRSIWQTRNPPYRSAWLSPLTWSCSVRRVLTNFDSFNLVAVIGIISLNPRLGVGLDRMLRHYPATILYNPHSQAFAPFNV